jgi:hypothetical protein
MDDTKQEPDADFLFDLDSPTPSDSKLTQASKPRVGGSRFSTDEARDAALRQELENIRSINEVIEGVVESLGKAKSNMEVCMTNDTLYSESEDCQAD